MSDHQVSILRAPAKLTLSLQVTGVRPDGYHLLDAEMVSLDLADTLEISQGTGISIVDEIVGGFAATGVPLGEENLVSRALALLGRSAAVRLVKRIPPGAGLGGGSADTAAILRWAGKRDPGLAAQLGADVPFCVRGGRARVRGIGEVVEPLAFEDRRFVLLLAPLAVSTAAVYRAWDERHERGREGFKDAVGPDGNDLEQAAIQVEPALERWRDSLHDATGSRPRLAGSGSAWFVEGDPVSLGLESRKFLAVGKERATLVAVRTVPPEPS